VATQPADHDDADATVSRQAHERVTRERDSAQARVSELEAVVKDLGLREKAIDYFRGKGVDDPIRWATLALPHIREGDPAQAGDRLDSLFGDLPGTAAPPAAPEGGVVNPPPTGFQTRGPNPAAEGQHPRLEPVKPGSEEWRKVIREEGLDGMRRLDRDGRIAWSAENLKAQGLRR
jgi:hypothetical protein